MSSDVIGKFIFFPSRTPITLFPPNVPRFAISQYFTIQYNTLFCKQGATHTTTATGEAKDRFFVIFSSLQQIQYLGNKNDSMNYMNYQNNIILTTYVIYKKSKIRLLEIRFCFSSTSVVLCLQIKTEHFYLHYLKTCQVIN
jgi:hypothetical protein